LEVEDATRDFFFAIESVLMSNVANIPTMAKTVSNSTNVKAA
jgi:hypothetical protein